MFFVKSCNKKKKQQPILNIHSQEVYTLIKYIVK